MRAAVAVAASGGRDSTALLHASAHAARALGAEVHALHVNHGLVAGADEWQRRLAAQCRRWAAGGLPLHSHAQRLTGGPGRGESVEAWARRERYRALAAMAEAAGCTLVLLAHHRRDQAETLLLQALRGGGPEGLASMPAAVERAGITWARPWLDLPREAVQAYVRRHRLAYVDDASNDDERFARNRLRLSVWPALVAAFPDAEMQLAAAARRAQEAAECLDEVAVADLGRIAGGADGGLLRVEAWAALGPARRRLALRHWLRPRCAGGVPETLVERLARELPRVSSARWPAPGGELRLHDANLSFAASAPARALPDAPARIDLSRPGRHELPEWGGAVVVESVAEGGLADVRLRRASLRRRTGGESFQRAPGAVARALKKQYQALRIPAWARTGPLVYGGEALLWVAGLGADARALAAPGEAQSTLRWEPLCAG